MDECVCAVARSWCGRGVVYFVLEGSGPCRPSRMPGASAHGKSDETQRAVPHATVAQACGRGAARGRDAARVITAAVPGAVDIYVGVGYKMFL
jgi:hypothetical protein